VLALLAALRESRRPAVARSTVAANLAHVLYVRGDYDRAEELTLESEMIGVSDDVVTQVAWRTARAMVLAGWGRHAEAEALAHEGIGIAAPTQYCECLAEGFLPSERFSVSPSDARKQ
jgi:Flp pilus assembly protein TadD